MMWKLGASVDIGPSSPPGRTSGLEYNAMPYSWNVFATIAFNESLPPTNQRRALTVFDATSDAPKTNVATCAVCSQLTSTAVFDSTSFMLVLIHWVPPSGPDGE